MSSNLHIFTKKTKIPAAASPRPLRGVPSPLPCSLSVPRSLSLPCSLSMTRRSERRAAWHTLPVPSPNGKPHPERRQSTRTPRTFYRHGKAAPEMFGGGRPFKRI